MAWPQLGLRADRQGPRRRTFSLPLANRVTKRSLTSCSSGRDGTTNMSLTRHAAGHRGWAARRGGQLCCLSTSLAPVSCLPYLESHVFSCNAAVSLSQPQNKPMPDLPRFQKHPRLCAAKRTAGFRNVERLVGWCLPIWKQNGVL